MTSVDVDAGLTLDALVVVIVSLDVVVGAAMLEVLVDVSCVFTTVGLDVLSDVGEEVVVRPSAFSPPGMTIDIFVVVELLGCGVGALLVRVTVADVVVELLGCGVGALLVRVTLADAVVELLGCGVGVLLVRVTLADVVVEKPELAAGVVVRPRLVVGGE